jgi:hypothetical protein
MIDFTVCRKCEHCTWDSGEELGVKPSVMCGLTGDTLLMNSDVPEGCKFSLEHKLTTQDVPVGFANYMSGCRRSP